MSFSTAIFSPSLHDILYSLADLLRDPLWQFVGVILSFAAIAASYLQFRLGASRKELAFGVLVLRRLVAIADEMASRVTVQLDGKLVSQVHLIEFGLKNSGNQPIVRNDFDASINIAFSAQTQVLSAQVIRCRPIELPAKVELKNGEIFIEPLLLNPGDFIVIQVLSSGGAPEHSVAARVAGVANLSKVNTGWRINPLPFFPFSHPLNGAPVMIYTLLMFAFVNYALGESHMAALLLAMAVCLVITFLGMWHMGQRHVHRGRYIDEA